MNLNGLKTTVRAYAKISKSIFDEFVRRDELGDLAWQSDAPIGTTDSYVRKNGAWVNGLSKDEIEETLNNYVTDVSEDMPTDKQYARIHDQWVEVEAVYHVPQFLKSEFIGVLPEYEQGDTVVVESVIHSESNILHIVGQKIYAQLDNGNGYFNIAEFSASEDSEITAPVSYSFVIGESAKLRLAMNTDIGNTYYSDELSIIGKHPAILYTGVSSLAEMTSQTVIEQLTRKQYIQGGLYLYQLSTENYVWWCTNFDITRITQHNFPIEYVKMQNTIMIDGIEFNCYRTPETLIADTYKFSLYGSTVPEPEPEVKIGDLRLGGLLADNLHQYELSTLYKKDFSQDRIYEVTLTENSYMWICTPNTIAITEESGMELDFITMPNTIRFDNIDFICYRSKEMLYSSKWRFKLKCLL